MSANFSAGDPISYNTTSTGRLFPIGQAGGGALPANNLLGNFSNLVSPDALEEFKIQTKTFAPEYGRFPGAQIELISRSGSNRYTGTLFEYFRNDKTDANDWFANQQAMSKPPLRFHNFGVTLGGPVRIPHVYDGHDRTFFFLSIDDLLLLQPQPVVSFPVATLQVRQNVPPAVASLLSVFPPPNQYSTIAGGPAVTGVAQFVARFSLRHSQQTYGLRFDHSIRERLSFFARYNRAPSLREAPLDSDNQSNIQTYAISTEMLALGLTHTLTPQVVNEMRLNGARRSADVHASIRGTAGARVPEDALIFPTGNSSTHDEVAVYLPPMPYFDVGFLWKHRARQVQFVDRLSWIHGTHTFKAGVDYRWFSPVRISPRSTTLLLFSNSAVGSGDAIVPYVYVYSTNEPTVAFVVQNLAAYAQDTWKVSKRDSR